MVGPQIKQMDEDEDFKSILSGASARRNSGDSPLNTCILPEILTRLRKVQQNSRSLLLLERPSHPASPITCSMPAPITVEPKASKESGAKEPPGSRKTSNENVQQHDRKTSKENVQQHDVALASETIRDLDWCVGELEAVVDAVTLDLDLALVKDIPVQDGVKNSPVSATGKVVTPAKLADLDLDVPEKKELLQLLSQPDKWTLDIFKVADLSNYRPLTCVTYSTMLEHDLFRRFQITTTTFMSYLGRVEASYRRSVPYHTSTHAADVVLATQVFICSPTLSQEFTDLEKMAALIASAIHDAGHPGLTNNFLRNSGSDIALVYSKSCLERYHLARGLAMLHEPNCDILANLSAADKKTFKQLVQEMVLATDMDIHKDVLKDMVEVSKGSAPKATKNKTTTVRFSQSDRVALLRGIVHTSDLSNPAKPLPLYENWCQRIISEFFRQGDKEKALGLPVSPMCDRETTVVPETQIGFMKYMVGPLFDVWSKRLLLPEATRALSMLEVNYKYHEKKLKESKTVKPI